MLHTVIALFIYPAPAPVTFAKTLIFSSHGSRRACIGRVGVVAQAGGGEPVGLFGTSCIDVGVPAPNGVEDDGSQAGVDEEISPGAGIGVLPPNASDVPAP